MSVVAVRGNLRLVDDGGGMGHLEGREEQRPLGSFLKWGYWRPVATTAAAGPMEGEEPLVRKYEQVLERNARRCRANYRRASSTTTAAGEEQNRNPQLDEVLDEQALSDSQQKALKAARERIARDAATAQAVQFGISFAVSSPYLRELVLAHAGRQAERIVAGTRDVVASIILDSLANGWTVPETADAIYEALVEAKKWQATMLARTDLIAMANGGSFAAAAQLAESAPVYKRWKNADDDRVRPTHVEAEDQLQPLQSPFIVGGAPLMFPGDPAGPDGEVINCRCTLVYTDNPDAVISAGWDESQHPRDPGGEGGGQWVEKGVAAAGALSGADAMAAWAKAYPAPIVTDDQAEAVSAYQGAWFSGINHKLRDPADWEQRLKDIAAGSRINVYDSVFNSRDATTRHVKLEDVDQEIDRLTGQLDRVLAKAPADMITFRYNYGPSVVGREGMGAIEDVYGAYDQLDQLEGKTITDPGFQSTTLDEAWVNKRLAGDPDGILHRIHVPEGTRSSYLPQLGASPNFDEEQEMLLARGLKMKATKVVRDGNKYTIDWEIVP